MADLFQEALMKKRAAQVDSVLTQPGQSDTGPDTNPGGAVQDQQVSSAQITPNATPKALPEPIAPTESAAPQDPFQSALAKKRAQSIQVDDPNMQGPGTISEPLNESPVSAMDRVKLSFGNNPGKIDYLKKKFQDVKLTEENGLLVKDQGTWKKVDPSGLGQYFNNDPWELTKAIAQTSVGPVGSLLGNSKVFAKGAGKEVLGDVADLSGDALVLGGQALGANVGEAAAGAPAVAATLASGGTAAPAALAAVGLGGVAGAGLGAGAGEAARTSLGRLVGTYQATPEEQIKDIGFETMMGAGGQAIALGAKPALSQLVKAGSYLKSWAPDSTKALIAKVLGTTSGMGESAAKTIMDAPEAYGAKYASIASKAGSVDDMINIATQNKIDSVSKILDNGTKALPKLYGDGLESIKAAAPSKFKVSLGNLLQTAGSALEADGIGKINPVGGAKQTLVKDAFTGATNAVTESAPVTSYKFTPIFKTGAQALDSKGVTEVQEMVKTLGKIAKDSSGKTLIGSDAVDELIGLNKTLNSLTEDAFKGQKTPAFQKAVASVAGAIRTEISQQFEKAGLGEEYTKLQNVYKIFGDSVNQARNILKNDGEEALTNKLASAAGKNLTAKGNFEALIKLGGKSSEEEFKNIALNDAVKNTASWRPKMTLGRGFTTTTAAGAAGTAAVMHNPLVAGTIAAGTAAVSSPKLVGKALQYGAENAKAIGTGTAAIAHPVVQYGFQSMALLRMLGDKSLKQLLSNPQALQHVLTLPFQAADQEQQEKIDLLQKTGVIPSGQQNQ